MELRPIPSWGNMFISTWGKVNTYMKKSFSLLGRLSYEERWREVSRIQPTHVARGQILWRNWDKGLKSFPPCYSPLLMDFTPPRAKVVKNRFGNINCELSRLCPETSTKLYVHKFGFWDCWESLLSREKKSIEWWWRKHPVRLACW